MKEKLYYPQLDVLKFLCCIGVVAIHTRPFAYYPLVEQHWDNVQALCVPLFFIVSSFLLWGKLTFGDGEDKEVLGHFVKRLAILYLVWTVVMLPEWLPGYIKHNPDLMWLKLLPVKLVVGAPHGSWFVVSLIYGTLLCYWVNRHLPVWVGLLLFAAMSFTPLILTLAGLPTEFGFFQLGLSVLVAPLPLQIGYMASRGQLRCMAIGGGSC